MSEQCASVFCEQVGFVQDSKTIVIVSQVSPTLPANKQCDFFLKRSSVLELGKKVASYHDG